MRRERLIRPTKPANSINFAPFTGLSSVAHQAIFSRFIIPSATFQQTLAPPGLPDRNISRQIHYQPDSVQDSVPRCARHAVSLREQTQPPDKHAPEVPIAMKISVHRQRHINFIHAEWHFAKPHYVRAQGCRELATMAFIFWRNVSGPVEDPGHFANNVLSAVPPCI